MWLNELPFWNRVCESHSPVEGLTLPESGR